MVQLASERKERVPNDFDVVASRYDLMTGLNPGYRRHLRKSAKRLDLPRTARILDLCCGTGLSTAALAKVYPQACIDGLDASAGMLEVARGKRFGPRVRFFEGNAMALGDSGLEGPYDGLLMAYGIRNMPDPDACLAGLLPLLKPGAPVCFHEYSVADSRLAQAVWTTVTAGIIIPAGLVTSPSADIYRYLRDSVRAFDGVKAFEARLRRAGFTDVRTLPMDGWQRGIVHSFLARAPGAA